MSISVNFRYTGISAADESAIQPEITRAFKTLKDGTGAGNAYLGWLDLPVNYDRAEFEEIKKSADKIKSDSQALVVLGIGGSYLGARAVIEFVKSNNYNLIKKDTPDIYFGGNTLSSYSLAELIKLVEGKDFSINVISKSGTTTETAVAFRVLKKIIEDRYGKEGAKSRIYVTTDRKKGALKALADAEGYKTFVVPDDVGGRYSVLTAVGLLPIAAAGIDIDALMKGAADAREKYAFDDSVVTNDAVRYAADRNILYRNGRSIEMAIAYEPSMLIWNEWIKQLYGESEGKDGKGLFPSSAIFSTDLHSLGQYIQQGERLMFETVLRVKEPLEDVEIPFDPSDGDGLNFLAGKTMHFVNSNALRGTILAHTDGNVPNIIIEIDRQDEYNLGMLIYFYEFVCAVSGYVLGINPFDQPGVESYKKNMFALLGKPGYEQARQELLKRIEN